MAHSDERDNLKLHYLTSKSLPWFVVVLCIVILLIDGC